MEILGIEITQGVSNIAAITGLVTTISTAIWAIIERRQKEKLKAAEIRSSVINNADKLHEIHAEILEGTKISEEHRNKYFINQIKFCEENIEEFIKFIKNKKDAKTK